MYLRMIGIFIGSMRFSDARVRFFHTQNNEILIRVLRNIFSKVKF